MLKDRVGEKGINNAGLEMEIIAYRGSKDIDIIFIESGYINKNRAYGDFKKGEIKDYTISQMKTGFLNDIPRNQITEDTKIAKIYWRQMIDRVTKENYKSVACYASVTICDEWRIFSNFYKWFKEHYRYDLAENNIKLEMDKDLISGRENKLYSPKTVVFIPKLVNAYITKRVDNPTGFTGIKKVGKRYLARLHMLGEKNETHLGTFDTPEEAHRAYVVAKNKGLDKVKEYMLSLGYEKELVEKITFYTMEEK